MCFAIRAIVVIGPVALILTAISVKAGADEPKATAGTKKGDEKAKDGAPASFRTWTHVDGRTTEAQ